ncbi:MAG TPA: nuclear transport factor 2 family protein, partial [Chloroflexia bacterium]|nr:nuclear transport factor 2 family protein [Chloroflexia bacterium]
RRRKADEGLSFEALRHAIKHCDLELMFGFYAEDAELSIVNASVTQTSPSELRGKAEVARLLRATFGQKTSRRVEREVVDEEQVTFEEACEYPDGSRLLVKTTLEVRDGNIVRQTDLVAEDARADATLPNRLLSSEQATEKEDYW